MWSAVWTMEERRMFWMLSSMVLIVSLIPVVMVKYPAGASVMTPGLTWAMNALSGVSLMMSANFFMTTSSFDLIASRMPAMPHPGHNSFGAAMYMYSPTRHTFVLQ